MPRGKNRGKYRAERRLGPPTPPDIRREMRESVCQRCGVAVAGAVGLPMTWRFCPACLTHMHREWQEQTAASGTESRLRSKYGIDLDDHAAMFRLQQGACAICNRTDRRLVVDHDHETGAVRGLLCARCNSGIGLLGDDADVAEAAVLYLRRPRGIRKARRHEVRTDLLPLPVLDRDA